MSMLFPKVFDNIADCRDQIEHDFEVSLDGNLARPEVFLRGEHCFYEKSESSMKRLLTASDGISMEALYYVQPFIDFEDIYAEYHSEKHRLSYEEGVGFLQHYGFPTDLLDITPSFETARFFACYGKESEPEGVLGVFGAARMAGHFTITDLSKDPVAKRPRNQHAYVARPAPGLHDLKGLACDGRCQPKWYRFKKSRMDFEFVQSKKKWIYPSKEELAHFFGLDLLEYFREQPRYQKMTEDQTARVISRLDAIMRNLD